MRSELPVRIAHRLRCVSQYALCPIFSKESECAELRDMQALPYVVVTQEGVAKVYEVNLPLYASSFTW